jgi:plasmid stability protein
MKTTLNLDDDLLREAKKRAAERGTTLTSVVEDGLRAVLNDEGSAEPYVFDFPTVDGGELIVDPADRDALYDLMEGRG